MINVPELLAHRLAFKRLHVKVVGFSRHDEEDDHRQIIPVHLRVQPEDTREEQRMNNVRTFRTVKRVAVGFFFHWETHSEEVVESRQRLQENISSFVGELVAPCDEKEQGLVQVEVQVPARGTVASTSYTGQINSRRFLQISIFSINLPIEMSPDKLLDPALVGGVQVLELMHS